MSPMHDIPVWVDRAAGVVNMVVEVPRWSTAKMEISLAEPLNPVKQDVKKGALRHVANVFPHRGYLWNYGALPQTWENPHHVDPDTQARGDNDPLDVLELGSRVLPRGSVVRVKVLGALALLDEGEMDWKLLAIDERDELAAELSGPADLERLMPGLLRASVEWFRLYKVPDGKPPNEFAWGGAPRPRDMALRLVDDMHGFWRGLVSGDIASEIRTDNTTVDGSKTRLSRDRAAEIVSAAPPPALPQALPDSGTSHTCCNRSRYTLITN